MNKRKQKIMRKIFEIINQGTDDTDSSSVGFVDNKELANRLNLGQGPMGIKYR